jgi:hypothetical protein
MYATLDCHHHMLYLMCADNKDPICISLIGVKAPGPGGQEYYITGDMMHQCGWDTYDPPGEVYVGGKPLNQTPKCFWMGGDFLDLRFPNKVQLHLRSFLGA